MSTDLNTPEGRKAALVEIHGMLFGVQDKALPQQPTDIWAAVNCILDMLDAKDIEIERQAADFAALAETSATHRAEVKRQTVLLDAVQAQAKCWAESDGFHRVAGQMLIKLLEE